MLEFCKNKKMQFLKINIFHNKKNRIKDKNNNNENMIIFFIIMVTKYLNKLQCINY